MKDLWFVIAILLIVLLALIFPEAMKNSALKSEQEHVAILFDNGEVYPRYPRFTSCGEAKEYHMNHLATRRAFIIVYTQHRLHLCN